MKWKYILPALLLSSSYTSLCYAMFCPNNYNVINAGDSIAKVEAQCGAPASKEVKAAPDNQPQEWTYFLAQRNETLQRNIPAQGTQKTTVAFDESGKVINMTVDGVSTGALSNCGSGVSIGMASKDVVSSCGKPSLITKKDQGQQKPAGDPNDLSNKEVHYIYNSNPPVTLVFIDGVLTGSK